MRTVGARYVQHLEDARTPEEQACEHRQCRFFQDHHECEEDDLQRAMVSGLNYQQKTRIADLRQDDPVQGVALNTNQEHLGIHLVCFRIDVQELRGGSVRMRLLLKGACAMQSLPGV